MKSETCTFQILFTSDVHGCFQDYDYLTDKPTDSGMSRISTVLKKEKKSFIGTTVICDIGDIIQGNGTAELVRSDNDRPFPLLKTYDLIGYDFVVLGNHEFNFGLERLHSCFEGYHGIKLCGNVFHKDTGKYLDGLAPYYIKQIPDGPRVAFIGMVSPNIEKWDKKHTGVDQIYATDAAIETKHVIKKLKEKDLADIFIAAQHLDVISELDTKGSGAEEVVKENPELAVFLGAHYHTVKGNKETQCVLCDSVKFVENLNSGKSYGKVLITATCRDGKWIIKDQTGDYDSSDVKTDVIVLDQLGTIENDLEIMKETKNAHDFIVDYMRNTAVGYLKGGPLIPQPQIKGTHEGILSCHALHHLVSSVMFAYTGADIVATPLNSYDANCEEGKITMGKVAGIYIYDNNILYTLAMTGSQVLTWMEWSYAYFGTELSENKPAVNLNTDLTIPYGTRKVYLHDQFSGIQYTIDLTQPVGKRIQIKSMQDGRPFDVNTTYKVACTNYRAETNLLMNSENGIFKPEEETAELIDIISGDMIDLIAEYIENSPNATIYNTVVYNWEFINLNWDTKLREQAIKLINNGTISDYDHKRVVTKEEVLKIINHLIT